MHCVVHGLCTVVPRELRAPSQLEKYLRILRIVVDVTKMLERIQVITTKDNKKVVNGCRTPPTMARTA